jgi:CDP-glucose 4,6-dehydratase
MAIGTSSLEKMERVMINPSFWNGKKVFITGNTGFKGSWLSIWLHYLGAQVFGVALEPPTNPNLYNLCGIGKFVSSNIGDIRDLNTVLKAIQSVEPDIIIHMAAQPLVRDSYRIPVETYEINIMGTINVLETIRKCPSVRAVVNVTTDKCYENKEWCWGYREGEPLGGYDPYSSSKACSELITSTYRNSFFNPSEFLRHHVALASARAGNVIGGGDWALDRLIPDCIRSILKKDNIIIRNPDAIRPWQHVLEPLSGYLMLAEKLFTDGCEYAEAWNFGPNDQDAKPVLWIVEHLCELWGDGASYEISQDQHHHEANYLKLDCSKARQHLGWEPHWNLNKALDMIVRWTRAYQSKENLLKMCINQIEEYM